MMRLSVQSASPVISVKDLVRHFPENRSYFSSRRAVVRAVDGVSFDVFAGETLAVVGESGCGKSTIGRLLVNVDQPTSGNILFHGKDLRLMSRAEARTMRRKIQMIFQDPYSSLNPRMTAFQTIAEPLLLHKIETKKTVSSRVLELMSAVGLSPSRAASYPHQFSGGQRQRIVIARALAVEPEVIVCDEPVSALDVSIRAQIVNLLQQLQRERNLTLLFISHDLGVVRQMSDRVAVMYLGKIVETGSADKLFEQPEHPYTQALLSAIPEADPSNRRRWDAIEGELPSPLNIPPGCRFNPRCRHSTQVCRQAMPSLEGEEDHLTACHNKRDVSNLAKNLKFAGAKTSELLQRRLEVFRRSNSSQVAS